MVEQSARQGGKPRVCPEKLNSFKELCPVALGQAYCPTCEALQFKMLDTSRDMYTLVLHRFCCQPSRFAPASYSSAACYLERNYRCDLRGSRAPTRPRLCCKPKLHCGLVPFAQKHPGKSEKIGYMVYLA